MGKRAAKEMSWSDGFQQLVSLFRSIECFSCQEESLTYHLLSLKTAFGEYHGHFNVPPPVSGDLESGRFYRWVQSLYLENRAMQNGEDSKLLSDARLALLANIGFKFHA